MLIAIPSKGRANKIKSNKILPSAKVYIPEDEEEAYRAYGVKNLVRVPNKVKGITPTRNWILNNTEERWVVFIDDDVKVAGRFELHSHNAKMEKIEDERIWVREWNYLFILIEEMGFRIWGLDTAGALRSWYPYKPFMFRTYITASCMGILNSPDLRFDESYIVKEDYEIGLRCYVEDGGILGVRYLFWVNSHWNDEGGCRDYRTQEVEERCIKKLIKQYPGYIRRVKRGGSEYSIELEF